MKKVFLIFRENSSGTPELIEAWSGRDKADGKVKKLNSKQNEYFYYMVDILIYS